MTKFLKLKRRDGVETMINIKRIDVIAEGSDLNGDRFIEIYVIGDENPIRVRCSIDRIAEMIRNEEVVK